MANPERPPDRARPHSARDSPVRSVYVSAMGPDSGKHVVVLGLMELLHAHVENLSYFRPVIAAGPRPDPQIELVASRYGLDAAYEEMYALADAEAQGALARGAVAEIEAAVLQAYRNLERRSEAVVCEGTDFVGAAPALEFDLNARLANQVGADLLLVLSGVGPADALRAVQVAREAATQRGCSLLGIVVARTDPDAVAEVRAALASQTAVFVLPEDPALACPTVGEVVATLGALALSDPGEGLQRDVRDVRIAATSVESFLRETPDGALVIVPGDRTDIVAASLAATVSAELPAVGALVLSGGYTIDPAIRRLLERAPFPTFELRDRTYLAATALQGVRPVLTRDKGRKIASALALFETNVDTAELGRRVRLPRAVRMTPLRFESELIERARAHKRRVVLPEGDDERVLRATDLLLRRDVAEVILLGDPERVHARAGALGLDLSGARVVDPARDPARTRYAARLHALRKHKGLTAELALDALDDVTYFATVMVEAGDADGMVSGAAHTTAQTVRPALEVIRAREGVSVVSSVFFMCLKDRVLVYGDCAVNPRPDVPALADIAISSAATASRFGIEPRVALLSYSTGASGSGAGVDAVRSATALVRERRPDLQVDGPLQYDAAVDASVAARKLPGSAVAGRATVLVFPDLDTGNIAYKAVQRSAGAMAVGPVLQGLRRPVNDLSRGCDVADIVTTVAITAIQAV